MNRASGSTATTTSKQIQKNGVFDGKKGREVFKEIILLKKYFLKYKRMQIINPQIQEAQ